MCLKSFSRNFKFIEALIFSVFYFASKVARCEQHDSSQRPARPLKVTQLAQLGFHVRVVNGRGDQAGQAERRLHH